MTGLGAGLKAKGERTVLSDLLDAERRPLLGCRGGREGFEVVKHDAERRPLLSSDAVVAERASKW